MKWIHRDVKPDNFLISASGHLKISDFGLAFDGHWTHSQSYYSNQRHSLLEKLGVQIVGDEQDEADDAEAEECVGDQPASNVRPSRSDDEECARREGLLNWRNRTESRKLARSIVGTSQYMAPEVIQGQAYDGRCDWWSVGIILYECIYGRTPFYCEDRKQTKEQTRLSSRQYRYPESRMGRRLSVTGSATSPLARHVYANDAEEIKTHKFFHGIPWTRLHQTQPPFVPRVRENQSIAKYFEEEKDIIGDESSSYESTKEGSRPNMDGHEESDEGRRRELLDPKDVAQCKADHEMGKTYGLNRSDAELEQLKGDQGNKWEGHGAKKILQIIETNGGVSVTSQSPMIKSKPKPAPKRARDKMLRDAKVGRMVMEMRKKDAFFGYTYRRPKTVNLEQDKDLWFGERGRRRGALGIRPTILRVDDSGV
ncbi:kinase-like protein [Acrodontium crateriforme]|uniref:non-specific serine/threonine protein kinase n=1 Tax=Acrodontium crateriforme TaxID=150365 RepID=A0AAQ3M8G2_9PEZI|nr:kinase-like protein [Acrodontium crateriforme]